LLRHRKDVDARDKRGHDEVCRVRKSAIARGRALSAGGPMAKTARHVIPNLRGGWSVRKTGASRATRVFDRQADAVRFGQQVARRERTALYVHRHDGTIEQKDTYGSDSHPSRGRR
jgi:uncharacterized protein DUF2188